MGGPLTSRLINDLPYPLLQAEHVCVEAIFSIPVTAFTPGDDAHLIPAVVKGALRKKHGDPNRVKSRAGATLPRQGSSSPTRTLGRSTTHQLLAFSDAYLHDKGSPTVAFASIPSLPFIGLVTLRKKSKAQAQSSCSLHSSGRDSWQVST